MFSLLVGIILLGFALATLYYILGRLRVFSKVGKFASSVKEIFEEETKKSNTDKEIK